MKLGIFEVIQLFKGASHLSNPTKDEQKLLSKIMGFLLSNGVEFELNQDEAHSAYDFICQRISHCTRERDMKSSRFNPKTYEYLLLLKDAVRYNNPYTIVENY